MQAFCLRIDTLKIQQFPLSMLILGQKALGPTIFKIPQPNWHYWGSVPSQSYRYQKKHFATLIFSFFVKWSLCQLWDTNTLLSKYGWRTGAGLPDGCLKTARWLLYDCPMTALQTTDDFLRIVLWLPKYLTTPRWKFHRN